MEQYQSIKQALIDERDSILAREERSGQYGLGGSMRDELSELSMCDNHPADVASELYERGKDLGIQVSDKAQIDEIDRALNAIDTGTYGVCSDCGARIDEERLQAHPTSLLCVACKRAEESTHPRRERPIEEAVLYPGYGQSFLDNDTSVEFDGEDSWQAVGRYNDRVPDNTVFEDLYMNDDEGIVDPMDVISNQEYREQLP